MYIFQSLGENKMNFYFTLKKKINKTDIFEQFFIFFLKSY